LQRLAKHREMKFKEALPNIFKTWLVLIALTCVVCLVTELDFLSILFFTGIVSFSFAGILVIDGFLYYGFFEDNSNQKNTTYSPRNSNNNKIEKIKRKIENKTNEITNE